MWSIYTVIFSGSLHKIRKSLKKEHNIEISHQSIENIIFLNLIMKLSIEIGLFPDITCLTVLWVKQKDEWKYLLALFDLELNTIVSRELTDSETIDNIYNFLNQSLRNQNKKMHL